MTADKRAVFTDALHTVGTIITANEKRDAVHFAVENVVAAHHLNPGAHVTRQIDGRFGTCDWDSSLGIVDPFIRGMVKPGDHFWLFLNPRTITSLRHVWDHPDFDVIEGTEDLDDGVDIVLPTVPHPASPYADINQERLEAFVNKERLNKDRQTPAWIWMRNYADDLGVDVDDLLEHADQYQTDDYHYWSQGDKFEGEYIPDRFWDHYVDIRGDYASVGLRRGSFFSCSC